MQLCVRLLVGLLLAACLPLPVLRGQTLSLAAAANLRMAMAVLKPDFEAKHPGATLLVSLGASGSLVAQIQQGAPFDVFLAADAEYPGRLEALGLVAGKPFPYATGHLVLWVRRELGLVPQKDGLKVLLEPKVKRISLGNPVLAPYGRSAEAALKASGCYEAVKPKLVFGESVAQAAQYLQAGAADAGFVSSPQVQLPALGNGIVWPVPQNLYPVQKQYGVLLKRSAQPGLAAAFKAYLLGPEAQAILAKQGYGAP